MKNIAVAQIKCCTMSEKFNFLDLRILEALGKHGPRNITGVARKLGMRPETLRKRLRHLTSQFFLRFNANIYHTYIGLKKALVFAEAIPGYEDLLFKCFKKNDFWMFVSRCYGMFEGCVGVFTIPKDDCSKFELFLDEIERLAVARNVQVMWSTCFQAVHSRCKWFDQKPQTWNFRWEEWIEEIPDEGTDLPYTLVDPEGFPIKGDYIDVFISKELEKDATINFTQIAEMLEVSPQLIGYHYHNHLIKKGILESFEVTDFRFGTDTSNFLFFVFEFDSQEKLAKFASSLLDKPFVRTLGKILAKNALYAHVYLPKPEFRRFIDCLSRLIRRGFLRSYSYVIQDLKKSSRQTISYEYFRDGKWIYDHRKHVRNLRELVEQEKPGIEITGLNCVV